MNTTMNILPPTKIDLSKIQVNQTMLIPLASFIPVAGAREASLLVKTSSATFAGTGTGPTFSVSLFPVVPSDDMQVYSGGSALFGAGPAQNNPPTGTQLYTGSNIGATTVPLGAWVNLVLLYTQYQLTVTQASVTFTVDLVLKS